MTKKLGELLNLPDLPGSDFKDSEPVSQETIDEIANSQSVINDVNTAIDKIDAALPGITDLDTSDSDLDELANLAKDKATDLLDLGMNVDPRFAGPIFQTASVLLGHSISAKTAKMDKKLRMISLQLQKARLDHQILKDARSGATEPEEEETVDGKGVVLDRNELLASIIASNKKQ